jgi:ATP-binding cassette subfamily B protein
MKTWSTLWQLIRYRPALYFADLILTVGGWMLFLVPAYVAREFFQTLTKGHTVSFSILGLLAVLVGAQLARVAVILGNVAVDVTFRFTAGALLRKNMLTHVLQRPAIQAVSQSPGQVLSRFRDDVNEATNYLSFMILLDVVGAVVFSVIALTMMMRIHFTFTLLVFVPLVGVVVAASAVSRRIDRYRQASRKAVGEISGFIGEVFGAVLAIQVAAAQGSVIQRFRTLNEERGRAMLRENVFGTAINALFTAVTELGTGVILLLAAGLMRDRSFTIGDFAAFVYYLNWVTLVTRRIGGTMAAFRQVSISTDRMAALAGSNGPQALVRHSEVYLSGNPPEISRYEKTPADRLVTFEATGLAYSYPDTGRGISDANIRLRRGQVTVITGRVGSGKSTLLRTILGLVPLDRGEIRWNGQLIADPGTYFVPPRTAYVAQVPRLFSETLRENILLGLPADETELATAVRAAALETDLDLLGDGLDTLVGPRGSKLSGGQIQRAAAARLFVRDPELIIIDDLSSALDVETERKLWDRLFEREGVTCLAISHNPAVLRRAHHVIVMEEGAIIAEGPFSDLLEADERMTGFRNHSA